MTRAVLGGVFDPPHLGHRALAEGALRLPGVESLLVLVAEKPGHKGAVADATARLRLAEVAFGDVADVRLDDHAFTVDLLRDEEFGDAVFVIGGDEWSAFETWKEPDEIRRLVRLAVAARPGSPPPEGDVEVFEIEQRPISSSEIRRSVAAGEPIDDAVGAEVAAEIARLGLYRGRLPSRARG